MSVLFRTMLERLKKYIVGYARSRKYSIARSLGSLIGCYGENLLASSCPREEAIFWRILSLYSEGLAEGLAALVKAKMGADPFSGTIYVFRANRTERVKLIF